MASQNFGAFINAATAATLAGTDLIPAVQASVTKSTTPNAIIALIGTRTVAQGGTGLATLTANAVMLGAGTGNIAFATIGTAGRVLADQGAAANPSFVAISGAGSMTAAGVLTVNKVDGITDGSNAAAGVVGEVFTSTLAIASATSLTTLTAKTITSITLTAGRWLIFGVVGVTTGGNALLDQFVGEINTTTNALGADESNRFVHYPDVAIGGAFTPIGTVPPRYVTISGTTTYYLIARVRFTQSTAAGYGRITAVRI